MNYRTNKMGKKKKGFTALVLNFWKGMSCLVRWFITLAAIVGGLFLIPQARTYFLPKHRQQIEANYDEGQLITQPIKGVIVYSNKFNDNDIVNMLIGSNNLHHISFMQIENGINLHDYVHMCGDPSIKIILRIANHHLFVTTTLTDLGHTFVGSLKDNYWSFYKNSQAIKYESDTSLRFTDASHNNILLLKFFNGNSISLQGYFVGTDSVLVMNNTQNCYSLTTQLPEARKAILAIK